MEIEGKEWREMGDLNDPFNIICGWILMILILLGGVLLGIGISFLLK